MGDLTSPLILSVLYDLKKKKKNSDRMLVWLHSLLSHSKFRGSALRRIQNQTTSLSVHG